MVDASGIAPDRRIGSLVEQRYKLIEAMASGSMGVVYKAERVPVGKLVAIKFLHAPFANDSEFLARFERETRVMSKLNHPNCVSVVDFGVWDGAPYLVMEYVSGTTLRALIDNGRLPIKRALALIRQIAAGLAHAHAQGVVHRDIKPANIMVSEEIGTGDHARILDFGLARLRGAVGRDATQSNVVVGTPNYMAPEQTVGGGLIDARTDIYAAGVVLFEMVCGDRPFQAEDTLALLGMHRAAPIPRLLDRMPAGTQLPRGMQQVVDKAMAKAPSDRFQSAIELTEAIDAVVAGRTDGLPVLRGTTEARKVVANAPTLLDVGDRADVTMPTSRLPRLPRSSFLGSVLVLAIVAAGVGATVWWIKGRSSGGKAAVAQRPSASAARSSPPVPAATTPVVSNAGSAAGSAATDNAGSAGSADPVPSTTNLAGSADSASGSAGSGGSADPAASAAVPAGSAAAAPEAVVPPDAGPVAPAAGSGVVELPAPVPTAVAGSGSDLEMDPTTAEDPAPPSIKPSTDEEEAANAPKTTEEVERHTPAAAVQATTLAGAVQLIQDGKHDLALASLRALWKKMPASAYIPFLLGNVYYDRRWWTVAMEYYGIAIKKNVQYKKNPTLNRNVIRMLVSDKTSRKAQGFLKYIVGKAAIPYLRYAAQHDPNSQVRRVSGWLVRAI